MDQYIMIVELLFVNLIAMSIYLYVLNSNISIKKKSINHKWGTELTTVDCLKDKVILSRIKTISFLQNPF